MRDRDDLDRRVALRGNILTSTGERPRRGRSGRVCSERTCRTILSVYNTGDRCWDHTPPTPYLLNVRRAAGRRLSA